MKLDAPPAQRRVLQEAMAIARSTLCQLDSTAATATRVFISAQTVSPPAISLGESYPQSHLPASLVFPPVAPSASLSRRIGLAMLPDSQVLVSFRLSVPPGQATAAETL